MVSRRDLMINGLALAGATTLGMGGLGGIASAQAATASKGKSQGIYKAGTAEKKLDIVNLYDLEKQAERLIPGPQFGYISSGSGDEWTLRENVRAFEDRQILPEFLAGVDMPDLSTTLVGGAKVSTPIFVPPMAAHGLAHAKGELDTAQGAAAAGALFTAQTLANNPLEEIGKVSNGGPLWFQLYYTKDQGLNRELIQKAKAMGATAIVFTVDLEWAGNREKDKRTGFVFPSSLRFPNIPAKSGTTLADLFTLFKRDLTFADLEFIRKESGLPVVVKGILNVDNCKACLDHGADAIQVSNHGGRQLDFSPASISVLPDIVEAVDGKVPVYLDGGVRRGVHVFQALALGAKAVAIGRPILYGLALGGAQGVTSVIEKLNTELKLAMKLAGCAKLDDIKRSLVS